VDRDVPTLHGTNGAIFNEMADKIAIITGSSSGIGLLTAIELAKMDFGLSLQCATQDVDPDSTKPR
jgi:hypothetical protein